MAATDNPGGGRATPCGGRDSWRRQTLLAAAAPAEAAIAAAAVRSPTALKSSLPDLLLRHRHRRGRQMNF